MDEGLVHQIGIRPVLQRDVVTFGLYCHDVGQIQEEDATLCLERDSWHVVPLGEIDEAPEETSATPRYL